MVTTPAIQTGNTLLGPPRLSGNANADLLVLIRWLGNLYDQMAKVSNVTGTLADHEARITALEARMSALEKLEASGA